MARTVYDLCCLLCCPPWPSKIAAKIAFQPPPPSYCFTLESGKCRIILMENSSCYSEWERRRIECLYATTSRGNRIACVHVKCTARPRYTILFSHGNASDLGHMCQFYSSLGTLICCNIFSYDYSGYGASSGKPSEKNMYADIECAWRTMKLQYNIPEEKIIVYGMSLGTVPTVDLAARHKVGAVILHSALSSALRVVRPNMKRTWCWDAFTTIEKVAKITSPVLVIHGTDDEIIPFSHGVALYEKCQYGVSPLWVGGAGHNNIEASSQYFERLRYFVNGELERCREDIVTNNSDSYHKNENKKITKQETKKNEIAKEENVCKKNLEGGTTSKKFTGKNQPIKKTLEQEQEDENLTTEQEKRDEKAGLLENNI